ncbi:hypothetical protein CC78DRAFT_362462 [Lojkania enalia]|uniref:Uncharacterized protein n=1 Tax=Lojkania enalia TaxID=147567 RepID=A0A9P4K4I8_9PLEO|nr:hypothetical protein CC78DRAFT_362462 [Didymosphaeria enalia]
MLDHVMLTGNSHDIQNWTSNFSKGSSSSAGVPKDCPQADKWVGASSPIKIYFRESPETEQQIEYARIPGSSISTASIMSTIAGPPGANLAISNAFLFQPKTPRMPAVEDAFPKSDPVIGRPMEQDSKKPRRPTLKDIVSSCPLPSSTTDARNKPHSRRPTLREMVSSPPSMPEMQAIAPLDVQGPLALEHATLSPGSLTTMAERETPVRQNYSRRPTVGDLLLRSLSPPTIDKELPPDPLVLSRETSLGSTPPSGSIISRSSSDEYKFKQAPQGNAFAANGFWSSIGEVESRGKENNIGRKGSFESNIDIARPSIESGQTLENYSFSTADFLRSVGRKYGVLMNENHPFPHLAWPSDPGSREAYDQVREALVAYWFSQAATRESTPDVRLRSGSSTAFLHSSPPETATRSGTSHSTFSRESPFRHLTSKVSSSRNASMSLSPPELPTKVSALPRPIRGKKNKRLLWKPPVFDKSSLHVLGISAIVLQEMQAKFDTTINMKLSEYIEHKTESLISKVNCHDAEEVRFVNGLTVKTMEELESLKSWKTIALNISEETAHFQTPVHVYDTKLDLQRSEMQKLRYPQKSAEFHIPGPCHHIIWATMFMEWAKENYERELKQFEDRLAEGLELKRVQDEMGLDEDYSDLDLEDSDSSDEDLTYVNMLREIQREIDQNTRALNSGSPTNPPSPTTRRQQHSSAEMELRRRRRTTAVNRGLRTVDDPNDLSDVDVESRAPQEEVDNWEIMLDEALRREKARQKEEAERRGRWRVDRRELRKDPTFTFEDDLPSPMRRDINYQTDSSKFACHKTAEDADGGYDREQDEVQVEVEDEYECGKYYAESMDESMDDEKMAFHAI